MKFMQACINDSLLDKISVELNIPLLKQHKTKSLSYKLFIHFPYFNR